MPKVIAIPDKPCIIACFALDPISRAAQEQSSGIQQVSGAVTQMDQITQQNAALVEEAVAAAGSLKNQAESLSRAVSIFKIAGFGERLAGA